MCRNEARRSFISCLSSRRSNRTIGRVVRLESLEALATTLRHLTILAPALPDAGVVVIIEPIAIERLDITLREIPLVRRFEEMRLARRGREGREQHATRAQRGHAFLNQLAVFVGRIVLESAAGKDDVHRS